MNTWIFQGNPERYDVADLAKVSDGKTETWLVSRHRAEMEIGDIVYFWRSGESEKRGIYAWGSIVGEPEYFENWGWGVSIKYNKRLPNHISSQDVSNGKLLSSHLLFRMPIGTNFRLSVDEANEVRAVVVEQVGESYAPMEV